MIAIRMQTVINISDNDRGINLTLSVAFDMNGDHTIEHPEVVSIDGGWVWFGKTALGIDSEFACRHNDDSVRSIRSYVQDKYANEIREAIEDAMRRPLSDNF